MNTKTTILGLNCIIHKDSVDVCAWCAIPYLKSKGIDPYQKSKPREIQNEKTIDPKFLKKIKDIEKRRTIKDEHLLLVNDFIQRKYNTKNISHGVCQDCDNQGHFTKSDY